MRLSKLPVSPNTAVPAASAVMQRSAATVTLAAQVLSDTGREPEVLVAGDGPHALAWRDWHAVAANAFGWCLLAHVVAAAAHVLEFLRD